MSAAASVCPLPDFSKMAVYKAGAIAFVGSSVIASGMLWVSTQNKGGFDSKATGKTVFRYWSCTAVYYFAQGLICAFCNHPIIVFGAALAPILPEFMEYNFTMLARKIHGRRHFR